MTASPGPLGARPSVTARLIDVPPEPSGGRTAKVGIPVLSTSTTTRSTTAVSTTLGAEATWSVKSAASPSSVYSCSRGTTVASQVTPARSGWLSASSSPWSIVIVPTTPSTPTTAARRAGATGTLPRRRSRSKAMVVPSPTVTGATRRTRPARPTRPR
jgi:hypothetical protein